MTSHGTKWAFVLTAVLSLLGITRSSAAQPCAGHWPSGSSVPGVNGEIYAMTLWNDPGSGETVVVVGGSFSVAGDALVSGIASWNPATGRWSALGGGISPDPFGLAAVYALAVLPNGDLAVGGWFAQAGGVSATSVARWDGSEWFPLGNGITGIAGNAHVDALAVLPNGDLVAGGRFTKAGDASAKNIARWNGSQWFSLGTGITGGGVDRTVTALALLPNGDLVAGGLFSGAGGVFARGIARWDGSAWSALGSGLSDSTSSGVRALAVLPTGDLVAGGDSLRSGGVYLDHIARWDGSAWSPLGGGLAGSVTSLAVLPNGDLLTGGNFLGAGGALVKSIARWDGSAWSPLGPGLSSAYGVRAITVLPDGNILAGGQIFAAGSTRMNNIALWNGSVWSALGAGTDAYVYALLALPNAELIAGGSFTTIDGVRANGIARGDGITWSALGTGLDGNIGALASLANGDLVAGGDFTATGDGVQALRIARWDGAAWFPLGAGIDGDPYPEPVVRALTVLPNGDLVVGGQFATAGGMNASNIALWDGFAWHPLGSGLSNDGLVGSVYGVFALAVLPNGDLVAGGRFTVAGGVAANHIARWDGSAWSPVGGMDEAVGSLVVLPDGKLVAGGAFSTAGGVSANRVALWEGSAWSALGNGITCASCGGNYWVYALAALSNGDVVAGGYFTNAGGVSASNIARWNGSDWSSLGSGMNKYVFALANVQNSLFAGGWFTTAGGHVSAYLARWATCQADFNCSGAANTYDVFDFLSGFLAKAPSADTNGSGVVTPQDLLDFIAAYFAGCT